MQGDTIEGTWTLTLSALISKEPQKFHSLSSLAAESLLLLPTRLKRVRQGVKPESQKSVKELLYSLLLLCLVTPQLATVKLIFSCLCKGVMEVCVAETNKDKNKNRRNT